VVEILDRDTIRHLLNISTLRVIAAYEAGLTRVIDMAGVAGFSRQRVSELLNELAKHGVVIKWYVDYTQILKQGYLLISIDEDRENEVLQTLKSDAYIAELHKIGGLKGYNILAKIVGVNEQQIELHLSQLEKQLNYRHMIQINVISTFKTRPRISRIIIDAYNHGFL